MNDIRIEKSRVPIDLLKYFEPALCSSCYICHLILVFREVRRVLRKDGVVFLNIGDSYSGSWGDSGHRPERDGVAGYQREKNTEWLKRQGHPQEVPPTAKRHPVIKPKDLCLIPFRLAIALQEDGWWVRSVIIWNKPNPMPESVKDRPSESHEYILMLTKSSRYFYDQEAIREHSVTGDGVSMGIVKGKRFGGDGDNAVSGFGGRELFNNPAGRNLRSVWTFPTQPYPKAHFATYPEKLVELCVKAATPEAGCCSKCGKPWVRITDIPYDDKHPTFNEWRRLNGIDIATAGKIKFDPRQTETSPQGYGSEMSRYYKEVWGQMSSPKQTLGWKPQCKCGLPQSENIGSVVLDCFGGAGTTALVATKLGRRSITYELSKQYCDLIVDRNRQGSLV